MAYNCTGDCQEAFEKLKTELSSSFVLSYSHPEGQFIVDTDASKVRGVLSQMQKGEKRVIGYFSKTLLKPERNYCITRREYFHKYLYGCDFLLRTDHADLKWLLQFRNPQGQMARCI